MGFHARDYCLGQWYFRRMYARYPNFRGQNVTRLINDQTVCGIHPKRMYLIKTLSIFFFYTPELYLR